MERITQIQWFKWMEKYPTETGLYNVVLRDTQEVWICYWNKATRRFEEAVPNFTDKGIDVDYWAGLPIAPCNE